MAWTLITVGAVGWGVHAGTALAGGHTSQVPGSVHSSAITGATASTAAGAGGGHASANAQAAFLERAVAATGGKATAALVHDYSETVGPFRSEAQLKQTAMTAGRALGLQEGQMQMRSLQGENFVKLTGQGSGALQAAVYCSSFEQKPGSGATVLVIRVTPKSADGSSLQAALVEVNRAVAATGMKPEVSAYVKTVAPGVDSRVAEEQRAQAVLHAIDAKPVGAKMQSGADISVSAYAPKGPESISTGGRPMNVQVGVHADHLNHQTDVIVGTPIIVDPF